MKKMILYLIIFSLLLIGTFVAWCFYKDLLAAALFVGSIIAFGVFDSEREEYVKGRHYDED